MSACNVARQKLADYVASLKKATLPEKLGTAIKAGYLASPKTQIRNFAGNLVPAMVDNLVSQPAAVVGDYLTALVKSSATFGQKSPREFRTVANTLSPEGLKQGILGTKEGLRKARQILTTGTADAIGVPGNKFDINHVQFDTPWVHKAVHGVFNLLEAADRPFFGFAFQKSLYGRARLMGIREGLSGKELTTRINELLRKPTEEMTVGATFDAQRATYKNRTALGDMASALTQGVSLRYRSAKPGMKVPLGLFKLGLDINLPFTSVASAIASGAAEHSPWGYVRAMRMMVDKDPSASVAKTLARATVGSGLMYLAFEMTRQGNMTGFGGQTPNARGQDQLENRPPLSFRLGKDGNWHSLAWLGELAIPMAVAAAMAEKGEPAFGTAVAAAGRVLTEETYLDGLQRLVDAIRDPERKGARALASQVPIPAVVRQTAQAIDPTIREAKTAPQIVQQAIPGLSKNLPAKRNPFGEEMRREGGVLGAYLDITNTRTPNETPLLTEMRRLGVTVGYPRDRSRLPDVGPKTKQALEELLESDAYQSADDDQRRKMLKNTITRSRRVSE